MFKSVILSLLMTIISIASGIGKRKKIIVLIYHRILDEPDFMRPDEVDKAKFYWQMDLLTKYFNVLTLHDALRKMENNTLPSRAVCITFDDGYADNYNNALPILKRFRQSAIFFIANGFLNGGRMWNDTIIESIRHFHEPELDLTNIGLGEYDVSNNERKLMVASDIIRKLKYLPLSQRDQYTSYIASKSQNLPNNLMMTSEQVKKLYQSGMEIGGHTVNHPILAKLDNKMVKYEVIENKIFLESLLNTTIRYFAYPNGKYNDDYLPQQIQVIKDAGYQAAASTQWGGLHFSCDRWQLPRCTPWDATPVRFMIRMLYKYCTAKIT